LAQCDGNNVLSGLRIDNGTNVGAYFGGLLGLVAVLYTLSCFVLWVSLGINLRAMLTIRYIMLVVSRYAHLQK